MWIMLEVYYGAYFFLCRLKKLMYVNEGEFANIGEIMMENDIVFEKHVVF